MICVLSGGKADGDIGNHLPFLTLSKSLVFYTLMLLDSSPLASEETKAQRGKMTCLRGQARPLRFCISHSTQCSAQAPNRLSVNSVGRGFPSPSRSLCVAHTAWASPNNQRSKQLARGPGYLYVICISLADPTQILAHQTWWPWGLTSPASSSQRWGNTERIPTESGHAGTCEVHTGTRHVAQCGLSPELHSVSSVTLDYSIDLSGHYFTGLLGESG